MAAPHALREVRYLSGTTFNLTFTNAAAAAWAAGTATKLRVIGWEPDFKFESEPDATLQQRVHGAPANIPTIRTGTVKMTTYLDVAQSDATASPIATFLSLMAGGIDNPAARTDAAEAGGSTTALIVTAHGLVVGNAVLIGTRGDAKGNAEVRSIATVTNANAVALTMATSVAAAAADALVYGTTIYFDEAATQKYIDLLAIGKSAEDQLQAIGCMGGFELTSTGPDQVPRCEFSLRVGDWQEVPSGERDQLEPASAVQGNAPPGVRGMGGFFIGDNGATTRGTLRVSDIKINPGLAFGPMPGYNGVNGIEGWVRVPSRPTLEFTALLDGGADPLPGLYDDFVAGTAKQIMIQWGTTAQHCAAVEFPKFYLDAPPERVAVGALSGVKIVGHGEQAGVAATVGEIGASPIRIHTF